MKCGKVFLLLAIIAGMTAETAGAQNNPSNKTDYSQKGEAATGEPLTLQQAEAIAIRKNPQITVPKSNDRKLYDFRES